MNKYFLLAFASFFLLNPNVLENSQFFSKEKEREAKIERLVLSQKNQERLW